MRVLTNDIHDPHGNDNHFADGFATERLFYRIEAQNGSLNFRILNAAGRAAGAFLAMSADSLTSRHSRCTKRDAPCTRSSLQITSRSGGESDSMNQRATSAP